MDAVYRPTNREKARTAIVAVPSAELRKQAKLVLDGQSLNDREDIREWAKRIAAGVADATD